MRDMGLGMLGLSIFLAHPISLHDGLVEMTTSVRLLEEKQTARMIRHAQRPGVADDAGHVPQANTC